MENQWTSVETHRRRCTDKRWGHNCVNPISCLSIYQLIIESKCLAMRRQSEFCNRTLLSRCYPLFLARWMVWPVAFAIIVSALNHHYYYYLKRQQQTIARCEERAMPRVLCLRMAMALWSDAHIAHSSSRFDECTHRFRTHTHTHRERCQHCANALMPTDIGQSFLAWFKSIFNCIRSVTSIACDIRTAPCTVRAQWICMANP